MSIIDEYIKINEKAFDDLAEEYQNRIKFYINDDFHTLRPFCDYLLEHFNRPINILDLGPGSGVNLLMLAERGMTVSAIELSHKMLKVAQKTCPQANIYHGNFLSFNFSHHKYEGILLRSFIHLFPYNDALKVIEKANSLLTINGIIHLATTEHSISNEGYFTKNEYHRKVIRFRRNWTRDELINTLEQNGFSILNIFNDGGIVYKKKWINIVAVKSEVNNHCDHENTFIK